MIKVDRHLYIRGKEGDLYSVTSFELAQIQGLQKAYSISRAHAADKLYSDTTSPRSIWGGHGK